MVKIAIVLGWAVASFLTAGFTVRDLQWQFPEDPVFAAKHYRKDLGFAILWSLVPVAWLLVSFLTGFFEHGWGFNRLPESPQDAPR